MGKRGDAAPATSAVALPRPANSSRDHQKGSKVASVRGMSRSETLLLTDRELIVDRVTPDGEREQHRLDTYWLRVELVGKDSERLVLVSRGNRVVIGRFLAPAERQQVAEQLNAALAAMRAPNYAHHWD